MKSQTKKEEAGGRGVEMVRYYYYSKIVVVERLLREITVTPPVTVLI